MKRQQPERKLQTQVAKYLMFALPPDAFFTAIPGGNGRVTTTPGYRSGTPDMLVIYGGRATFLELKAPKGVISDMQEQVEIELDQAGAPVYFCRNVEDAERALRFVKIPLRASVSERRAA